MLLNNQVAIITGGAGINGLGFATARMMAEHGAKVVIMDLERADPAGAAARLGPQHLGVVGDVTDKASCERAVTAVLKHFGRIDILVNNAGVLAVAPLEEFKLEDFDQTLAINVRSVFIATQEAARHMGEGGRIINIGSTNAERMPFPGGGPYAMSKAALVGLTKGLARDLGPKGITINNVQPGPVDTDMNPADSDFAASLMDLMAIRRYGHAEEVAGFVAYLASPEAGYITGASLSIDGGFSA